MSTPRVLASLLTTHTSILFTVHSHAGSATHRQRHQLTHTSSVGKLAGHERTNLQQRIDPDQPVGFSNHGVRTWKPLCIECTVRRMRCGVWLFGGAWRCRHEQEHHHHHHQRVDVMTSTKDNETIAQEGKGREGIHRTVTKVLNPSLYRCLLDVATSNQKHIALLNHPFFVSSPTSSATLLLLSSP